MPQKPNYELTDKVAFITGASTGIGRSTAMLFAKSRAKVMVADINTDAGLLTAHLIGEQGGVAEFVKCDVAKEAEVKAAIDKTVQVFGGIDYAFNNAGIEGEQAATSDCTTKNWDKVIQTNLSGVWFCMKYQIPEMLKRGGGAIVNCSSIAGLIGFPGIPAYTASKHAVIGLTKAAALEYAKSKIRVNAVCPGVIQTPMIERFVHGEAQALQQLSAGEPIGRIGQPEEIADSVLWLCSDSSSFITGHSLAVDGGWVAQ
jgi:NAD(P)-dependent dehydrogenase (short-subunit alcohol dehydrogenase family)